MKYCTVCKAKYEDGVSFCPVDGEVLEDDPSSIVNTVLDGQYQIEALLGKGGMGAVFSARHILLERDRGNRHHQRVDVQPGLRGALLEIINDSLPNRLGVLNIPRAGSQK